MLRHPNLKNENHKCAKNKRYDALNLAEAVNQKLKQKYRLCDPCYTTANNYYSILLLVFTLQNVVIGFCCLDTMFPTTWSPKQATS